MKPARLRARCMLTQTGTPGACTAQPQRKSLQLPVCGPLMQPQPHVTDLHSRISGPLTARLQRQRHRVVRRPQLQAPHTLLLVMNLQQLLPKLAVKSSSMKRPAVLRVGVRRATMKQAARQSMTEMMMTRCSMPGSC